MYVMCNNRLQARVAVIDARSRNTPQRVAGKVLRRVGPNVRPIYLPGQVRGESAPIALLQRSH